MAEIKLEDVARELEQAPAAEFVYDIRFHREPYLFFFEVELSYVGEKPMSIRIARRLANIKHFAEDLYKNYFMQVKTFDETGDVSGWVTFKDEQVKPIYEKIRYKLAINARDDKERAILRVI